MPHAPGGDEPADRDSYLTSLTPEQLDRMGELLGAVIAIPHDLDASGVHQRVVDAACAVTRAGAGELLLLPGSGRSGVVRGSRPAVPADAAGVLERELSSDGTPLALLRLAAPEGGDFDQVALRSVEAVVQAAGHVLGNVALHERCERRRRWLEGNLELARLLVSDQSLDDVLDRLVEVVCSVAEATAVALVRPHAEAGVALLAGDGDLAERRVVRGLLRRVASGTGSAGDSAGPGRLLVEHDGGLLVLAALTPYAADVVLVVWFADATEPVREEVALLDIVGSAVTIALQRDRARSTLDELVLVSERQRIAADLHDVVIQRVFAAGLHLRGVAGRVGAPEREVLDSVVDELNGTIRDIRATIFELQRSTEWSLREEVRNLAAEYTRVLDHPLVVHVDERVDALVERSSGKHLLAVLREALANVARHAAADHCWVDVYVVSGRLRLVVEDDGRGVPGRSLPDGGGLANLRWRAVDLGGTLEVAPGEGLGGTRLTWQVPLRPRS